MLKNCLGCCRIPPKPGREATNNATMNFVSQSPFQWLQLCYVEVPTVCFHVYSHAIHLHFMHACLNIQGKQIYQRFPINKVYFSALFTIFAIFLVLFTLTQSAVDWIFSQKATFRSLHCFKKYYVHRSSIKISYVIILSKPILKPKCLDTFGKYFLRQTNSEHRIFLEPQYFGLFANKNQFIFPSISK